MKKYLTNESEMFYAESLKTSNTAFAPVRFAIFLYSPMAWMRAENNQYQPKLLFEAFSESTPLLILNGDILRKIKQMTNTIITTTESTLQSLYRYYSEMKSTWYKGKYTIEQENVYFVVFAALEDAIQALPIQCKEDRKVKFNLLKDRICFPIETNEGVDFSKGGGFERESLDLIEQLAAE